MAFFKSNKWYRDCGCRIDEYHNEKTCHLGEDEARRRNDAITQSNREPVDTCHLINDGTPCPDNITDCCEICYKWDEPWPNYKADKPVPDGYPGGTPIQEVEKKLWRHFNG